MTQDFFVVFRNRLCLRQTLLRRYARPVCVSHTREEKNRVATNNYEEVSLLYVCIGTSSGSLSGDPRGNSRAIEDSLFCVSEV